VCLFYQLQSLELLNNGRVQLGGTARANKKDSLCQFKGSTELLHFLGSTQNIRLCERRGESAASSIVLLSERKLKELRARLSPSFFQLASSSGRVENRRQRSVEETNCSALKVNYQMELGIPAQAKLLHSEIDVQQQTQFMVVGLFCVCFMNDAHVAL
jgi:hypothetical protein